MAVQLSRPVFTTTFTLSLQGDGERKIPSYKLRQGADSWLLPFIQQALIPLQDIKLRQGLDLQSYSCVAIANSAGCPFGESRIK